MRIQVRHLLLCLTATLLPLVVNAGTFRLTGNPWYEYERSDFMNVTLVMVGAEARYEGTIDSVDRNWTIQTYLNWNGQHNHGRATTGVGIPSSREVKCEPQSCGANLEIPDCDPQDNPYSYRGGGGVAIIHPIGTEDEIDTGEAPTETTICVTEIPSPDGDDPESPSGDGSGTEPVVIDLDRGGFRFTNVANGVLFDLDADGVLDQVSWTDQTAGDAFLVLDRNGNGTIDDGKELFGDKTEQPVSSDPHGFAALSVFDQPGYGGNGDGWINADDGIFPSLALWEDSNHDGVSQFHELAGLTDKGVIEISLSVRDTSRLDWHGNYLRFITLVRLETAMTQAVGVYLQME